MLEAARPQKVLTIGADRGVVTEVFLLLCDEVVVMDPWDDYPDESFAADHIQGDAAKADFMAMRKGRREQFFARCGGYENLTVIRDSSPRAQGNMLGAYTGFFDLVYIDGVHEYQPVIDDARASWPLVRDGGWFAGHDYVKQDGEANRVIPAVDFLFGAENIQSFSDSSWLTRRPDTQL
jgi:hypothetical protein